MEANCTRININKILYPEFPLKCVACSQTHDGPIDDAIEDGWHVTVYDTKSEGQVQFAGCADHYDAWNTEALSFARSRKAQLDFERKNKVEVAIDRLQHFEPPEGYYLAFSGGKDSTVLYQLAVESGVKFDAHYSLTGIDPPELVRFVQKNYPAVELHRPPESVFKGVLKHGLPRRQTRWCCELLKERNGTGRWVLTGIDDSTKTFLHPIIDWSTNEVWEYITRNKLPYCSLYDEGFSRLGCVLCPMASKRQIAIETERWPKIAAAWKAAAPGTMTTA